MEPKTTEKTPWWVYEPSNFSKKHGHTADESRCRHHVSIPPHYILYYQCSRKPVEFINGYGLCKQHAKMVRKQWEKFQ